MPLSNFNQVEEDPFVWPSVGGDISTTVEAEAQIGTRGGFDVSVQLTGIIIMLLIVVVVLMATRFKWS